MEGKPDGRDRRARRGWRRPRPARKAGNHDSAGRCSCTATTDDGDEESPADGDMAGKERSAWSAVAPAKALAVVRGRPPAEGSKASCLVCFETLHSAGDAVALPCDCRAMYCHRCWDRALNAKYDQTKEAQCPTCRCPMRVDFHMATASLKFTKLAAPVQDLHLRERIQEQTKPFQIRLLEKHGRQLRRGKDGVPHCGSQHRGPACICGSRLVLTPVRKRVLAFVAEFYGVAHEAAERHKCVTDLTDMFLNGSLKVPITCDICERVFGARRVHASGQVWTCRAGSGTLLHGLSYDVCEGCYARFVVDPKSP